jgi:hypothetical protein
MTQKKRNNSSPFLLVVMTIMGLGISAIVVLASSTASEISMGYPQKESYNYEPREIMKPGEYAAGTVSSIQNDKESNSTWVISGVWKGSLIMDKSREGLDIQNNNATNSTSAMTPLNTTAKLPTASFEAIFSMIMTNGSAMHKHSIYDFKLTEMAMPDNNTSVFNGTATVIMKNVPVQGIPVSIKILGGNIISIWTDPTKLNNHFGDTPIFGTVMKDVIIKK